MSNTSTQIRSKPAISFHSSFLCRHITTSIPDFSSLQWFFLILSSWPNHDLFMILLMNVSLLLTSSIAGCILYICIFAYTVVVFHKKNRNDGLVHLRHIFISLNDPFLTIRRQWPNMWPAWINGSRRTATNCNRMKHKRKHNVKLSPGLNAICDKLLDLRNFTSLIMCSLLTLWNQVNRSLLSSNVTCSHVFIFQILALFLNPLCTLQLFWWHAMPHQRLKLHCEHRKQKVRCSWKWFCHHTVLTFKYCTSRVLVKVEWWSQSFFWCGLTARLQICNSD